MAAAGGVVKQDIILNRKKLSGIQYMPAAPIIRVKKIMF